LWDLQVSAKLGTSLLVKVADYERLPVNIGNPNEFTILECAKAVLEVTRSDSQICTEPLPQDDPKQRRPDINKARTRLGWEPRIDLPTGLRLSLDYFRSAVLTAHFKLLSSHK
jgi:dTDP-glucose 4,6-dehydratase